MFARMILTAGLLSVAWLAAGAAPAKASFLNVTMGYEYYFPTDSTVFYAPPNFVVTNAVEMNSLFNPNPAQDVASFDVQSARIVIDYHNNLGASGWAPGQFNGFRLFDVNSTLTQITGVSIDASTNMAGLDASDITFDGDNIRVNWQGLGFDSNTLVVLNVEFANAVPVPAGAVLFGLGMASLGGARLIRRRKVAA